MADRVQAEVVSVREGVPAITEGPYLETKEYLSSAYLLDVTSQERALEIAGQIPGEERVVVTIRPRRANAVDMSGG